jgi:RHS repeat-associated protein
MLEERRLLAVDWRNPVDALDVDGDHLIVPLDALLVINYLNSSEPSLLPSQRDPSLPYWDVTGDQSVVPRDALLVITHLNEHGSGTRKLTESPRLTDETEVVITVGQFDGSRTFRARVAASFDATDQQTALEDTFAVYLVNPNDKQDTLLDRGEEGTTLFTLAGERAEFTPGVVRWDGSILEIDLTAIGTLFETAELRFQLLNNDSDLGSRVEITPLANEVTLDDYSRVEFATDNDSAAIGGPLNLASLSTAPDIEVLVENVRLDPITLRYKADLRLRNKGAAVGRDVAAIFRGLFQVPGQLIVAVEGASGTATDRAFPEPYINFRNAIPSGGLRAGMTSDPITVTFFDPQLVAFFIRPEVKAGANHAPVINPLGPFNVMPGSSLSIPLQATDADGDQLTYSLQSNPSLPTGELGADGTLVFRPTPTQLGAYTFNVEASDGAITTTRTVTLNVNPDPITTTRVSGVVRQVNGQPLANMRVEVGAVQAITGADGTFMLDLGTGPLASDTIKVRGDLFTGSTSYPFIAERLSLVLEHDVFLHYNNVITRPIYLPVLDDANAKQINPLQDTLVTTDAIPGASVMIKAGTLMNQQGSPFTGKLSITEVPRDLTPAALPNGLRPDLVVTIQPGEMVFSSPAPISLPNRAGYPAGTIMDLWSINPASGEFDKVGKGRVTADGSTIETISGGIRNSSWHDFLPVLQDMLEHEPNPRNKDDGCDECPKHVNLTSEVELHSGALIETHDLVTYQSSGVNQGLSLVYDSLRADPRPIVYFDIYATTDLPPNCSINGEPCFYVGTPIPTPDSQMRLAASLSVNAGNFNYDAPGYTGSIPGLEPGENFWTYTNTSHVQAALQADLSNLPSNIYTYTIRSGFVRGDQTGFSGALSPSTGQVISVNAINSPFGAGWGLAGLQTIVVNDEGFALLIDGDGSEMRFIGTGDAVYQSPPGDFTVLERVNGLFRRTTADQTVYRFNANHQLASITDRLGNVVTYQYTGSRLDKIIDPTGLETVLTYTGSRVTTITDPAGRVTRLTYDSAGNLLSIEDPDTAKRTWEYDVDHHMVAEVDQLGRRETTEYDAENGRVIGGTRKDGSQIRVSPIQTQGLLPASKTRDPINSPALKNLDSAQAGYMDGNGTVSQIPLDRFGQAQSERDRFGQLPTVARDARNMPIAMIDGRGNPTLQSFDDRGALLSVRDTLSGGGAAVGAISPAGEVDRYTFTGRAGQRLYLDGPRGSFNAGVVVTDSEGNFITFAETYSADFVNQKSVFVLPRDGEYSVNVGYSFNIQVPEPRAESGSYQFRLIDVDLAPPLPIDSPLIGSLSESQFFQIEGERGQTLRFTDLIAGGSGLFWPVVFDFQGRQLSALFPDIGVTEYRLTDDASFSVMLTDFSSGRTARYEYNVELIDAVPAAKTGLDVDHTGTLPAQATISAPAGTPLLFYWFDKGIHSVRIPNPGSFQPLLDTDFTGSAMIVAPQSGNYTVSVAKTVDENGNAYVGELDEYAFRLVDLTATPEVSLNSPVAGTLVEPGRIHAYRFQGTAGQRIDFGEFQPGVAKSLLLNQSYVGAAQRIVTLPQTGEYTILVQQGAGGDVPLDYDLTLRPVLNLETIQFDTLVQGQLLPGGERKYYQLDLAAGDEFYFDDLGSSSQIRIYDQGATDFAQVLNGGASLADVEHVYKVQHAKKILIVLDAAESDRPANFQFRLHSLTTHTTPLAFDQLTQADFTAPIQDIVYTFQGSAGQRLFLDQLNANSSSSTAFSASLVGPSKGLNLLPQGITFDSSRLIVLPESGEYRLTLPHRGATPEIVRFRLLNLDTAPLITLGSPQQGTISLAEEADLFRFEATAGQRLTLDMTAAEGQAFPEIYDPSGLPLFLAFGDPTTFTVDRSGTYALSLRVPNAGPLDYAFVLSAVSDAPVVPSGLDHQYSGTGNGAEQTIGNFQANAGTLVFFDAQIGQGALRIYDPSNELVPQVLGGSNGLTANLNSDSFIVLPRSGQYTVKVETAGDYAFRLQSAENAPLFTYGQDITGSLSARDISDLYRFTVAAGQTVRFDHTAGGSDVNYTFFLPNGSRDFGFGLFAPSTSPTILSIPGIYYVAVSRLTDPGPYGFQIHDFDAAPEILFDTPLVGIASPASQLIVRKFSGIAGQKVYVNSSGGLWVVYDQSYRQVDVVFDADVITLPTTGDYYLERDNDELAESADFTVTLSVLDDPLMRIEPAYVASSAIQLSYDSAFHQMTSVTDELGRQTLFDIDPANGNTRSITRVVGTAGGNDDQVSTFTYLPSGLIDTVTDPLGRITDYDYDSRRNVITVTSARGTSSQTSIHYEYDTAGNVTSFIDENNHRTNYEYDRRNRLTKIIEPDPDGAGPLSSPVTQFTYDLAGNNLTVTDANQRVTRLVYDALDRVRTYADPGNNTTTYTYDAAGNLTRLTDPLNHVNESHYDERGRLRQSTDAAGKVTQYEYDGSDNLTSIVDASGNRTTYVYDARDRLIRMTDPLGQTTTYSYDSANNLRTSVDRMGRTLLMTYDDLDRLVQETWKNTNGSIANTIHYSYDDAGNLNQVQDDFSTITYAYDELYRVTQEQTTGPGGFPTSILSYTYDAAGNLLSRTDVIAGHAGGTDVYSYDALNQLTRIVQSGPQVVTKRADFQYNSLGQTTSLARFSDAAGTQLVATTNYLYDSLNRLNSITHRGPTNTLLDSFTFQYDSASRISRVTDLDGATDYTYDSRDQLTAANHADPSNPDETYAYDDAGNRLSSHVHGKNYQLGDGSDGEPDNNRLTSDGTFNYAYDDEGNLVQRISIADGSKRDFVYDLRNRLIQVTDRTSGGVATRVTRYTYDAFDRRISKNVDSTPSDSQDGVVTYFVYAGSDVIVEWNDPDGAGGAPAVESMRYLHGPAVDQVLAQEDGANAVQWHLADHLGTVHGLVSQAGQVVNHLKYDSYGNLISETNPAVTTRYRFTGREFDQETGLMYYRARYYDPAVGRFISEDSWGLSAGVNLYAYVGNSPSQAVDPFGHEEGHYEYVHYPNDPKWSMPHRVWVSGPATPPPNPKIDKRTEANGDSMIAGMKTFFTGLGAGMVDLGNYMRAAIQKSFDSGHDACPVEQKGSDKLFKRLKQNQQEKNQNAANKSPQQPRARTPAPHKPAPKPKAPKRAAPRRPATRPTAPPKPAYDINSDPTASETPQ